MLKLTLYIFTFVRCSKYDLYSKSKVQVDVEKVKPYYLSLIEKVSSTRFHFIQHTFHFFPG